MTGVKWSDWMTYEQAKEYIGESLHKGDYMLRRVGGETMVSVPVPRKAVKREKVDLLLYANGKTSSATRWTYFSGTHRITFDTVNGEPDCTTIKMEKL